MENETVGELIERLKGLDQDAIMCFGEIEDDKIEYSTFEICNQFNDVKYIDNVGDIVTGKIVALY